ncbi:thioesterase family protein [Sporichthya brevicatena]|uniref:Thioesterase family protein n=1 Tax=Sporichthya brevicatena TaxID=171442 RepID=A0ABN1H8X5_9ACTN
MTFAEATAVSATGPGRYTAELTPYWSAFGNPNGGYLAAITARAALAETGREHPQSVSTTFFKASRPGPAELEVTVNGTGRTLSNARVLLRQNGVMILESTVVCTDTPTDDVPADPSALPVDESRCAAPGIRPGTGPSILDSVSVRYPPGFGPRDVVSPERPDAVVTAWVRLLTGEDPDPFVAIVAADALVPTPFQLGYVGWSPTVSMTWHLRTRPAPGPLAVTVSAGQVTPADGWFDERAVVRDSAGRTVAHAWQIARLTKGMPEAAPEGSA